MSKIGKKLLIVTLLAGLVACGKGPELHISPGRSGANEFNLDRFQVVEGKNSSLPACNERYFPSLKRLIRSAQKTIDVCQFTLNDDRMVEEIFEELGEAVKRGVEVRVVAEDSIEKNASQVERLRRLGVQARLDKPFVKLHSKMVIIDGKKAIIGSTNWSYMSMRNNNETNILLEGPVVSMFEEFFANIWTRGQGSPKRRIRGDEIIPLIQKDYFHYLVKLFSAAKESIFVNMYGIKFYGGQFDDYKPDVLLRELVEARRRGVDVRVIVDQSDFNKDQNELNREAEEYLEKGGVKVYWDPIDVISHAKLVIVDNTVVVGSANWGVAALRDRLETNVAVSSPKTVSWFKDYFRHLWSRATDLIDPRAESVGESSQD